MIDSRTIKILVSCPGDVTYEKDQIIRMCKDFSDANHGRSNIEFKVLDWRDYVGEYGTRGQQQLKEYFGVYDVYIGLLWKRFGTPPGSINSNDKENESGTEEEFYDASEYQKSFGRPKIHFFIKTYERDVQDFKQSEQIGKVFRFIEEQRKLNNNYLNSFNSNCSFNSSILKLLLRTHDDYDRKRLLEEKDNFVSKKIKIADFKTETAKLPITYIERSTSHFTLVKDKLTNPLLETEHQSLDQLMISNKRVVLLGDAGSGKTTELKNLQYKFSQDTSPFVPIIQNFNSYTPDLGLEGFLPNSWKEVPSNFVTYNLGWVR